MTLFETNEDYFHILPQIWLQHFYNEALIGKKPILETEPKLRELIQQL